MALRTKSTAPKIYCDFNGQVTARGFMPKRGTVTDLAALGLTLEDAVGRRFVFVMDDADDHGNPDDIMCDGTVVRDAEHGILLEIDGDDFYWRSEMRDA